MQEAQIRTKEGAQRAHERVQGASARAREVVGQNEQRMEAGFWFLSIALGLLGSFILFMPDKALLPALFCLHVSGLSVLAAAYAALPASNSGRLWLMSITLGLLGSFSFLHTVGKAAASQASLVSLACEKWQFMDIIVASKSLQQS